MATVIHSSFSDVTREVPDAEVQAWTNAGWTLPNTPGNESAEDKTKTTEEEATDTPVKVSKHG